jgi:hypothetical protein
LGWRRGRGLSGEDIDRLADDLIAEDRGEATERFIDWAIRLRRAAGPHGLVTGLDRERCRAAR